MELLLSMLNHSLLSVFMLHYDLFKLVCLVSFYRQIVNPEAALLSTIVLTCVSCIILQADSEP